MELCQNDLEQYIQTSNVETDHIWAIMRDISNVVHSFIATTKSTGT